MGPIGYWTIRRPGARNPTMPQTIALVDDDRNILTSVSMTLEQEGFNVRTYTDGESALQGLLARPADLAVLDIKMPRMDGMELLQRIRQRSNMPVERRNWSSSSTCRIRPRAAGSGSSGTTVASWADMERSAGMSCAFVLSDKSLLGDKSRQYGRFLRTTLGS